MEDLLHNPVYNALITGDAPRAAGMGKVKYFNPDVSPFVGFPHDYSNGFNDLHQQLPSSRDILYATPATIKEPKGWKLLVEIEGLQFVLPAHVSLTTYSIVPVPLDNTHVDEMVALATLTRPGPFGPRTIEFGHYHGIFHNGKLVAMTGQRLHVGNYTELSAVCTHPAHLGKGYAGALMLHQIELIRSQGKLPFLHVRADNERAIALYERLGFVVSRGMNFYFMRRLDAV